MDIKFLTGISDKLDRLINQEDDDQKLIKLFEIRNMLDRKIWEIETGSSDSGGDNEQ